MMVARAVPIWLAFVCCIAGIADARAQSPDFPSRPIKIIVSLAPGGLADPLARIMAQRLTEASGQPAVVDRAGAVGTEAAARSPADGYTVFDHVQGMFDSVTLQTPLINDGKTRRLAVLTHARVEPIHVGAKPGRHR